VATAKGRALIAAIQSEKRYTAPPDGMRTCTPPPGLEGVRTSTSADPRC
jgi:hypothetical protein